MAGDGERHRQRFISFVALFLMGASAALAPHADLRIRLAPPAAATLIAVYGWLHPGPGAAVAVLGATISVIAATGIPWQATMPLALCVFYLATRARPPLGTLHEPMGHVPVWGTVGCAAVTPLALVSWFALFRPDLTSLTQSLPKGGPAALVLGALGFALITAFCEELIWRGVLQTRLTALLSHREAIFVQALSFGTEHAHGFPRGLVGVTLAGVWAIALGRLRKTGGGLLAPMLAHVVADATIAAIVIFSAQ